MSGPVLLVHDDIGTIAAVRRVLTRAGHEVVLATSAADAMIAFGHHLPTLIILGPAVESGRGPEVLSELSQHPNGAETRVLLLGEEVAGYAYPVVPLPLDGASFLELFESALQAPAYTQAPEAPSLEDTLFGDLPVEPQSTEQRAHAAVEYALEQAHQEFEAEAVAELDASLARADTSEGGEPEPVADLAASSEGGEPEWDPFGTSDAGSGEAFESPRADGDDELAALENEVREEASRRRQARLSLQQVALLGEDPAPSPAEPEQASQAASDPDLDFGDMSSDAGPAFAPPQQDLVALEEEQTRARRAALLQAQREAKEARIRLAELREERLGDGASIQLESDALLHQKQKEWAEREERIRRYEAQRQESLRHAMAEAEAARELSAQVGLRAEEAGAAQQVADDAAFAEAGEGVTSAEETARFQEEAPQFDELSEPELGDEAGFSAKGDASGSDPQPDEQAASFTDLSAEPDAFGAAPSEPGSDEQAASFTEPEPLERGGADLEVDDVGSPAETSSQPMDEASFGESAPPLHAGAASFAEGTATGWNSEPLADPDSELELVGDAQPVSDSAPLAEAEPEPDPVGDSASFLDTVSEPDPFGDSGSFATETEPDPVGESDSFLATETEPDPVGESASFVDAAAEPDPVGDSASFLDTNAEPELVGESDSSTDTEPELDLVGESASSVETEPELDLVGESSSFVDAEPELDLVGAPASSVDAEPELDLVGESASFVDAELDLVGESSAAQHPFEAPVASPAIEAEAAHQRAALEISALIAEEVQPSSEPDDWAMDLTGQDTAIGADFQTQRASAEAQALTQAQTVEEEEVAAAQAEQVFLALSARGQVASKAAARALAMAREAQQEAEDEARRQAEAAEREREERERADAALLAQAQRDRQERDRLGEELRAQAQREREERERIAAELQAQTERERLERLRLEEEAEARAIREREEGLRLARAQEAAAQAALAEKERLAEVLRVREEGARLERETRDQEARILAEHARQEREARERLEQQLQTQLEHERLERERVAQELEAAREAARASEEKARSALLQVDEEKHGREESEQGRRHAEADAEHARAEAREMAARAEAALVVIPKERGVIDRVARTGIAPLEKLAELIRELTSARVDVRLELKADDALRVLWLRNGGIAGALSTAAGETLLDRARQDGLIDPAQLRKLSPYKDRPASDQLSVLRESGLLRESEVIPLVQRYTEAVALAAFSEAGSLYRLATEAIPADVPLAASTRPVIHLLAEGLRRGADPVSVLSALGGLRAIPVRKRSELEPGRLELSERERRLLESVDGVATIESLLLGSGVRQDTALRVLVVARALGMLELMPASEASPSDPLPELEVQRLNAKLSEIREADYFTVLGVPRSAGKDEVLRAYELLSTEFHPLRFSTHPDPGVPRRAEELQSFLSEAVTALGDDRLRGQYARNLAD